MKNSKPEIPEEEPQTQRFLRLPDVCALTGLKVSTIYEMMAAGTFPRSVPISKRLVVWPEKELAKWQAARLAERGSK